MVSVIRERIVLNFFFIPYIIDTKRKFGKKKIHFGRAKNKMKKKRQVLRKKTGLGRKNADKNQKRKKM